MGNTDTGCGAGEDDRVPGAGTIPGATPRPLPRRRTRPGVRVHRTADDGSLVDAYIDGDDAAFSEIVRRHRARLWRVARRYARSDDEADDIVQDALLRASRHLSKFRGDSALTTWLHRLVVNSGYDHLGVGFRRREFTTLDASEVAHRLLGTEEPFGQVDLSITLRDAIGQLPEDQRQAILLVDLADLPVDEVAAIMKVRPGTVKSRRARARSTLKALLTEPED
ncbi:sigma-70 family RNA polymerase sigma factor [Corynebacterium sp. CCM 8835]|uniref:Sigma-70 family RNA polymerase sigma factor n=1 Tax=Corynebacterium antarcticum TaxID=2800405 RepID=A0ABS1FLI9_9CORY|nr:sigma-70 family RNA polymerase sigma factor [Corynebacterium antarcticum]MCK7642669.1 sigma-70 family RNA polymerase sigma factor [Corynebacterium antarcticum]MCK7660643.1 sigma-70 family RNA polymerase sigma factor [Corynebacterium antarcticum]MCL0245389.1 sigma-70 family RNA polymerase sigma factor [Corynebacterium antarcticum]MCX7492156.1 sigma-70 family RNA polymerase sigma factor [Corynebacterium antarcticum]MCX7539959.1 sigma-70 family RNA polymerase sigma factor [Corynebacterium anta